MQTDEPVTVARQLISLCPSLGVDYIFSNFGSDHPAFIEALAALSERGLEMPRVVVCPHEMTALSAAHAYAMLTRRPQIVLVHVDVGTQNLGCSVHNAARGRVPAIIIAGLSPTTDSGDRTGARNEFIHYLQDASRQHEIVGQYVKWAYELRSPETVGKVLMRAIQIATASPEGPVYITGAREVWDATIPPPVESETEWSAVDVGGLPDGAATELYRALKKSERPIVITSYLGRQPGSVERLVELSDRIGIGICEASPQYLNFPGSHPHHLSYRRNSLVNDADLILMLDVDVPWIASKVRPAAGARLFHIDQDPLKQGLGFWHFPAQQSYRADTRIALDQLLGVTEPSVDGLGARREWIRAAKEGLSLPAGLRRDGPITAEELTEAVRDLVTGRTVIVFEEPSSTELIPSILRMDAPGSFFSSGGSGLGWGINAAIGVKLAKPDAEVITLVGDGCYFFGVPSSAYWVAATYKTPHLTIIYNNGGWKSPKLSTEWVHSEGSASRNDTFWVGIGAGARLADVAAAAGDVRAFRVTEREELKRTLGEALEMVRGGRSAVVDVSITQASRQVLG
ncbi:MAG TPA: thiamine pyrophosphate-requiring protein [Blastocatellia bacterium]|nr:thiamine pyrophosphate-requiring protein [Blastocatellia bacterium]